MTHGRNRALTTAALLAVLSATSADAFPPYRSTDAGTADPWVIEARLGVLRLRRDGGDNIYSSPLFRLNLGLPHAVELTAELEFRPAHGGLTDAAFRLVPAVSRTRLA